MTTLKNLTLYAIFALCCVCFVGVGVCYADTSVFTDNLETYTLGQLLPSPYTNVSSWTIENTTKHTGNQAVGGLSFSRLRRNGTALSSGTGSYWFYIPSDSSVGGNETLDVLVLNHDETFYCGYFGIQSPAGTNYYALEADHSQHISINTWHLLSWSWGGGHYTYWLDGGTPVASGNCTGGTIKAIDQFRFDVETNGSHPHFYIDDFGSQSSPYPTATEITIDNPASGSTITSQSTNIVVNWWNIDYTIYPYIWLNFISQASNISSELYSTHITTTNGSFTIPASTFGITENGQWNLRAVAEYSSDLFLDLLSSQTYSLNFNIGGLPTPYAFSNFNTWYSANAAGGYTAPSDWATSLTGFIQPIFVNAGEFVNNSLIYFKSTDFYSKGNQLGLVFPTTQAYLNKINIFFGGFPLIQFFELLTFVMLGIFIVRTIFKFIPFFG